MDLLWNSGGKSKPIGMGNTLTHDRAGQRIDADMNAILQAGLRFHPKCGLLAEREGRPLQFNRGADIAQVLHKAFKGLLLGPTSDQDRSGI